jgi:hypothetical protein
MTRIDGSRSSFQPLSPPKINDDLDLALAQVPHDPRPGALGAHFLVAQAPPSVGSVQAVATVAFNEAISDMHEYGHRLGNGTIFASFGNFARNTGLNPWIWKCEDQAPFAAGYILLALRRAGMTDNTHVGLVRTPGFEHTFVVVVVGGTREAPSHSNGFNPNVVRGGVPIYYDPWTGKGPSLYPPAPVGSVVFDQTLWEIEPLGQPPGH